MSDTSDHSHARRNPGPTPAAPPDPSVPRSQVPGPPTQTERNWAIAAHLSGFVAAWIALGVLGPLAVMLTAGNTSAYVRRHAVEAVNFNISILIYSAISALLVLVKIGFVLLLVVGLAYLVASVLAATSASRGQEFRYPLTLRFVS